MHRIEEVSVTLKGLSIRPETFVVPGFVGVELKQTIKRTLKRLHDDGETTPAEEVFPELKDPAQRPGLMLKGARLRLEMTQERLARKLKVKQHHLSEMERGKRSIGKAMAQKLAAVLDMDYRLFL